MKNIKIYLAIFTLSVAASCTDGFEEIDAVKDFPSELEVGTLLPGVIFEPLASHGTMDTWLTDQVMHYYVRRNDNQIDAYDFAAGQEVFDAVWQKNYATIRNANDLIALAEEQELSAYVAAGKIMKAYNLAILTEVWIDAPSSEAGVSDVIVPKYDAQQQIFTEILTLLTEANTALDDNSSFVAGGDVLFGGDISRWKKMANSLKLRYLLRGSNKTEINAATEINKIFSDPATYPIITSNDDMAFFDFTGVSPSLAGFAAVSESSLGGLSMSKRVEEVYEVYDDPRVDFFFEKPSNATEYPNHEGVPNGVTREIAQGWNTVPETNTSEITPRFHSGDPSALDYTFITHAEVQFILAEASMEGWITGDGAKSYYDAAITANFAQWSIDMPAGFLDLPEVAWNDTMERLMDQKWMAYFFNSTLDSWGEHKRTGLPVLNLGSLAAATSGGDVATRGFYPELEQSINSANYNSAISNIGGDIITAKHWYQD